MIQKAIEKGNAEVHDVIVAELERNVARCIQDQNGNHVIQKCVEAIPDRSGFVIEAFRGRVQELATHAYGCRVIQCMLQHCPAWEAPIVEELAPTITQLVQDQFGNYVVQHVLMHADASKTRAVGEVRHTLIVHFFDHSTHKFASNVMEKLVATATSAERDHIIDRITQPASHMPPEIDETGHQILSNFVSLMMRDQYANYVVQKLIGQCDSRQHLALMSHVQPYVGILKKHSYGKHLISRLERAALLPVVNGKLPDPATAQVPWGSDDHGKKQQRDVSQLHPGARGAGARGGYGPGMYEQRW